MVEVIKQEVHKACWSQCVQDCLVMGTHLYLDLLILAVFAMTVANAGIYILFGGGFQTYRHKCIFLSVSVHIKDDRDFVLFFQTSMWSVQTTP